MEFPEKPVVSSSLLNPINLTSEIDELKYDEKILVDPTIKTLEYNPTVNEFAPIQGPINPFKSTVELAKRNTLIGFVEPTNIADFNFENERRTKQTYGYSLEHPQSSTSSDNNKSIFESAPKRSCDKRKKDANYDATDIDNYTGPWAKYVGEKTVAKPSKEEQALYDEYNAKMEARKKKPRTGNFGGSEFEPLDSDSRLYLENPLDYQGRSFMIPPSSENVNLKSSDAPVRCRFPKKLVHQWKEAHRMGVSVMRLFPKSGHLLLTGGMDKQVRLWELYGDRRLVRSYSGHREPIKDICFNNNGSQMLTSSYDKYVKLWDVERGDCLSVFTNKHIANVVRFNPCNDKQHLFLAGCANKKILCYDIRSGEIVQMYERHLGAVNSITFFDQNRRFVSTSDDRSLRLWEWDIPVDYRQLADASMHSMPAVALSPGPTRPGPMGLGEDKKNQAGKWLACQSLDNQIITYNLDAGFKKTRKVFKNRVAAGSACQLDFSPDMRYLISGDGDGNVCVWDFKTCNVVTTWLAHDRAVIASLWLPHEISRVVTAGRDGIIKIWD